MSESDNIHLSGIQSKEDALTMLVQVVTEWVAKGKTTTSAGVKSGMRQIDLNFDEQRWGFETFLDFLHEAENQGLIHLGRSSSGHPLVLLPGSELPPAKSSAARPSSGTPAKAGTQMFRDEVWDAFVSWRESSVRIWDRVDNRPIVYPVTADGAPAWTTDDADSRFVTLPAADMHVQIEWMREFAESRPEPVRTALLESLTTGAPKGAFSRALQSTHTQVAWRQDLHTKVTAHIQAWAESNGVDWSALVSMGKAERPAPHRRPADNSRGARPPHNQGGDDLRAFLHRVIDAMPIDELTALPIKAHYFISIDR